VLWLGGKLAARGPADVDPIRHVIVQHQRLQGSATDLVVLPPIPRVHAKFVDHLTDARTDLAIWTAA
jgi:hypothetical protein